MHELGSAMRSLAADRRSVTVIEYTLIGGLLVSIILAGVQQVAGALTTRFATISTFF